MEGKKHPEFKLESERLIDTKSAISWQIEKVKSGKYSGGNEHADVALRRLINQKILKPLQQSKDDPYFGRVDFIEDGQEKAEEIYIGYRLIERDGWIVCDWRAPISGLFYSSLAERQAYESPDGTIAGRMFLKRRLDIGNGQLIEILDEIDGRKSKRVATIMPSSADDYLLQHLYSRGDPRLQDIVKTIQQQQDKIIRAPANRVMIINRVAGSGKTSIAYHRLAYLLYPDNKTKFQARNTIIFGPNRLFLSYTRELLPGLGVNNVVQVTFDDWAMARMRLGSGPGNKKDKKFYTVGEVALEKLLAPNSSSQERTTHSKRAQLKGSFKMKRLLDEFIKFRQATITIPEHGLQYTKLGQLKLDVSLPKSQVKAAHTSALAQKLPLEKQRERMAFVLRNKLVDALAKKYKIYEKYTNKDQLEKITKELTAELERRLKKDINSWWPGLKLPEDYYGLLLDRKLLERLQIDPVTSADLKLLLSRTVDPNSTVLDLEDIPALYYLYILAQGRPDMTYDHIVVDEAQDLSPLQFHLLQLHNPRGSMTILGDISQGVYAHRGISDWSEIRAVFQSQPHYEEITQNYRSTYQIVAFTNEVLKRVRRGKKVILADPFSRFGEKPTIVEAANREKMFAVLAEDIKLLKSENVNNIAVIVKTVSECQSAVDSLKKYGVLVTDIIANRNTEFRYSGGTVVLPAALAKGIEFEAALVVNADAKNYAGTVEYDGRLLYVAITRALHYLNVYFVGSISPFLELAKDKAVWRSKAQQMVWQKQFTIRQLKKRNGKIDPNEDKMLEEDLTRMLVAQKERTERNMPRRDFDGSFVSSPLRDDYGEDSSAEYNEYNWWE